MWKYNYKKNVHDFLNGKNITFLLESSSEFSAQGQVLHCKRRNLGCSSAEGKLRNQGCSSTRDWIGTVASCCFLHPTHPLTSEQTSKDLKRSQGPSGLHQNSPQGLNTSSIRVFDQIRDLDIYTHTHTHTYIYTHSQISRPIYKSCISTERQKQD